MSLLSDEDRENIRANRAAVERSWPPDAGEDPSKLHHFARRMRDMAESLDAIASRAPHAEVEALRAEVERLRAAGESLLLEACHMATQLLHRGLPGVKGDSVDRAIESMRDALIAARQPAP